MEEAVVGLGQVGLWGLVLDPRKTDSISFIVLTNGCGGWMCVRRLLRKAWHGEEVSVGICVWVRTKCCAVLR